MPENDIASRAERGWPGRLTVWIVGATLVVGALVRLLARLDDLTDATLRLHARVAGPPPSAPAATAPVLLPAGAGLGTFVRAVGTAEADWLAARLRRVLELEGVQLAPDPALAQMVIDLAPPQVEAPQAAPPGSPLPYGVRVLLEARVLAAGGGPAPVAVVQREARGLGATPTEAEARARQAAADLLGRRLAETLQ